MASIFTRIIEGELPGEFVWRDPEAVAFLSIHPVRVGHTLVIPRLELPHWLDLEPEAAACLTRVAHAIGRAQMRIWSPARVGLMIAGFEVAHVHLHVLPMESMRDLDLSRAASSVPPGELAETAGRLRDALRALGHAEASE